MEASEGNDAKSDNDRELRQIFTEFRDKSAAVLSKMESVLKDLSTRETKDGMSWLELKNHLLLSYLMDLNFVFYHKFKGESIANIDSIRRLVEYRTVLERMRPIDQKLKYQIQKMQRIAVTGEIQANDPLRFRANPDAFDLGDAETANENANEAATSNQPEDCEGTSQGSKANRSTAGVYVAPKITPMHYFEDETEESRRDRLAEKAKRRALNSSLIAELQREFDDAPQELREEMNPHKELINKRRRERERYEEDNFVRLHVSKQERHAARLQGISALDDIVKFGAGSDMNIDFDVPNSKKHRAGVALKSKAIKKKYKRGFKGKSRK